MNTQKNKLNIRTYKPPISEYGFLELFVATMVLQKQPTIIKKYDLQESLYNAYDNPEFHFLFGDICRKTTITEKEVDLDTAFQKATIFGLLVPIINGIDMTYIIVITEETAKEIVAKYNEKATIAMDKLCAQLQSNPTIDKPQGLTRTSKKQNKKENINFTH